MKISLADLQAHQNQMAEFASKPNIQLPYSLLSNKELEDFGRSFERQFIWHYKEREISDIYMRHLPEILLGAMIAKNQMDNATIGGEIPPSNQIGGPLETRACWLGIGDDWEDAQTFTTGSEQNWIHSGTTLMGGTSGHAIKIGGNAVHVVIGIESLHPSPKLESIKFEIDGKKKPILVTKTMARPYSLRIKEFDNALILRENTTVLGTVFASAIWGSTITDYPKLLSVSFIKEPQLRLLDPADIPGTTQGIVLTT